MKIELRIISCSENMAKILTTTVTILKLKWTKDISRMANDEPRTEIQHVCGIIPLTEYKDKKCNALTPYKQ